MRYFDKDEVLDFYRSIPAGSFRMMTVYMIGGGAMALRGEKEATKDIDLVVESHEDSEALRDVLLRIGFRPLGDTPEDCFMMTDAVMLERRDGLRIDIFVHRVCGGLVFSDAMRNRSEFVGDFGGLLLYMAAREDIFLFKSVTGRARDVDDMLVIYDEGLDKETVFAECARQNDLADPPLSRIWEAFLLAKIEEMEEKSEMPIPWKRQLRDKTALSLERRLLPQLILEGKDTVRELASYLKLNEQVVRRSVRRLEAEGIILSDKGKRPNILRVARWHK